MFKQRLSESFRLQSRRRLAMRAETPSWPLGEVSALWLQLNEKNYKKKPTILIQGLLFWKPGMYRNKLFVSYIVEA